MENGSKTALLPLIACDLSEIKKTGWNPPEIPFDSLSFYSEEVSFTFTHKKKIIAFIDLIVYTSIEPFDIFIHSLS